MSSRLKINVSSAPRKGSVRFLRHGAGFGRCDEHFIVVLIPDCDRRHCVVIGVVTSQIEKREEAARRNGFAPETVVRISPSEYAPLRVESAVDCNSVKKLERAFFDSITANAIPYADMPNAVVNRILEGVVKSDNVSESIKVLARSLLS